MSESFEPEEEATDAAAMAVEEDELQQAPATDATGDGPPPRLMITKLVRSNCASASLVRVFYVKNLTQIVAFPFTAQVLENFKSYGGTQVIDNFHHCFSAVVGPNGSGKSNVIDALLFVFGKRAKQLRLNKVSELIHNSSSHRPSHAKVSVYFQDVVDENGTDGDGDGADQQYSVVPNSQHVLSRVARQDNTSVYQLDGKNCPFKTVATFLGSKGLDLDNNRFLILQGEVEMISMMPPRGKNPGDTGLLEYLEEIIGSSQFVERTDTAEAQIEALTTQRQEKLQRCKATQGELEALQGAKQEAMALLQKQREIQRKHNIVFQIQLMNCTKQQSQCEKSYDQLKSELDEQKAGTEKQNERLSELQNGMEKQQSEYEAVHQELVETKEQFAAYERRDIKLKEELKHLQQLEKKTAKKIAAEGKKHDDAVVKGEEARGSIPKLEAQVEKLNAQKAREDAVLDELFLARQDETHDLRSKLEEKSKELAPIQQELSVFKNEYDTAQTQVKLLQDATTRAKTKLANAESELESLDGKQATAKIDLKAGKDELVSANVKLEKAIQEDKSLVEKEGKLSAKNKQLMVRLYCNTGFLFNIGIATADLLFNCSCYSSL